MMQGMQELLGQKKQIGGNRTPELCHSFETSQEIQCLALMTVKVVNTMSL